MKSIFIVLISYFLSGCTFSQKETQKSIDSDNTVHPPVEKYEPNTKYTPAFKGQTRISGVKTKTKISASIFAKGLESAWGMTNLPDDRILVTQKRGTMVIVSRTGSVSKIITGFPPVNSDGQGGLLDVAIDPNFSTNRMIYWSYSKDGIKGNTTAVAKGRLSEDESKVEHVEIIYVALPEFRSNLHYGSRLVWDKNENLFVSTGERSNRESRPESQYLNSALGKVLRITKEGRPAQGNPFLNTPGALPEIYSYGHRNVQGLAIHPTTGELWEGEFGPRGGDEINRILPGKNYGWPTITYGIEYSGEKVGDGITKKDGMEQPVYYWDPSVSNSGMTFYSGKLISEWTTNLFLVCLSGQHVVRLVIEKNKVVGEERLLEKLQRRWRDVLEGNDGALYVVTDGDDGIMYRIGK